MIEGRYFAGLEQLPVPRKRIEAIVDNILSKKSILLMIQDEELLLRIKEIVCILLKRYNMDNVNSVDTLEYETPREYFAKYDENLSESIESIISYYMQTERKVDLIVIENLDKLPVESQQVWCDFINKWGQKSKSIKNKKEIIPLLVLIKDTKIHECVLEEVFIKHHWYWGWISDAEIHIAFKSLIEAEELQPLEKVWVESIFMEICGPDLDLLQFLLKEYNEEWKNEDLFKAMRVFASKKGLKQEMRFDNLSKYIAYIPRDIKKPTIDLYELWEKGAVDLLNNNEVFISSALFSICDDLRVLNHRIWRGQAKYLLPILDRIRHEICTFLHQSYNHRWETHCIKEQEEDEEFFGYSIGFQLENIVEFRGVINFLKHSDFFRNQGLQKLKNNAEKLRKCRNKIAHCINLERDEFVKVINAIKEIKEYIYKDDI